MLDITPLIYGIAIDCIILLAVLAVVYKITHKNKEN